LSPNPGVFEAENLLESPDFPSLVLFLAAMDHFSHETFVVQSCLNE